MVTSSREAGWSRAECRARAASISAGYGTALRARLRRFGGSYAPNETVQSDAYPATYHADLTYACRTTRSWRRRRRADALAAFQVSWMARSAEPAEQPSSTSPARRVLAAFFQGWRWSQSHGNIGDEPRPSRLVEQRCLPAKRTGGQLMGCPEAANVRPNSGFPARGAGSLASHWRRLRWILERSCSSAPSGGPQHLVGAARRAGTFHACSRAITSCIQQIRVIALAR